MIRYLITLFSVAGLCAMYMYCKVNWYALEKRNVYLELKAQESHLLLFQQAKKCKEIREDRKWLASQVWILSKNKRRRKYRNKLKELIKKRNKQYGLEFGIGGR